MLRASGSALCTSLFYISKDMSGGVEDVWTPDSVGSFPARRSSKTCSLTGYLDVQGGRYDSLLPVRMTSHTGK